MAKSGVGEFWKVPIPISPVTFAAKVPLTSLDVAQNSCLCAMTWGRDARRSVSELAGFNPARNP